MLKLKKILNLFINIKIIFKKPVKADLLLFDGVIEEFFAFSLKKYKYEILHIRLEKLNFWILISTLLQLKFDLKHYCINYIKYCEPKLILTSADNAILFYQLKKYFNDIKFVSVQNGYRFGYQKTFKHLSELKNRGHDLRSDFIFFFGNSIKNYYKKFIKFKPLILGSYRNNSVPISKKKIINNSILHISGWRTKKGWFDESLEKTVVSSVASFCFKYQIKLYILPYSKKNPSKFDENLEQEEKFFKTNLKKYKFKLLKKNSMFDSYKLIDKFNLITFIDSTLGYESISRGKKIVSFSIRKIKNNRPNTFGFPEFNKKSGFFFTCKNSNNEFNRILSNTWRISQKNWKKKYFKKLNNLMIYNTGNSRLYNLIDNILKN